MSDLHTPSRRTSKTRLIIEPENSRFKDPVTPHRYNTRLSARFFGEDNTCPSSSSSETEDSTVLNASNSSDMSLRTGISASPSTHLNPCSEPSFFSPGKVTKYSLILMTICGIAMFGQQFFVKYSKTIDLESDLTDVKKLMNEMKSNMEAILKAKAETTKVFEDIDQLFHKLEKQETENKQKVSCPERMIEGSKQMNIETIGDNRKAFKVSNEGADISVMSALDKFSADKTGLPDFALESSGGEIIAIPNTHNYNTEESVSLFGWKLCSSSRGPSLIIQPSVMPGQCWAFRGSTGSVIIKLMAEIIVTAVTVEHIPKQISPSNDISSAPKEFAVYGVDNNSEVNLGKFMYDSEGDSVQTFPTSENMQPFSIVRFDFLSNHGNPLYTCVYRVRVHGNVKNDSNNRAAVNSL